MVVTRLQVVGGAGNWRTMISGVDTDYPVIRDWALSDGVFFGDVLLTGSHTDSIAAEALRSLSVHSSGYSGWSGEVNPAIV